MTAGVDYSYARPDLKALWRGGYTFACRYLSSDAGKALGGPELLQLRTTGFSIVLVFENAAGAALGGARQGLNDGRLAVAQAKALAAPQGMCLFFAIDQDATADAVRNYFQAVGYVVSPARYRVGAYGPQATARQLVAEGTCALGWVAGGWRSGKALVPGDPANAIVQEVGPAPAGCDVDHAWVSDFGQWPPPKGDNVQTLKLVTPSGQGCWYMTLPDGGVYTEGDAPFFGSLTGHPEWQAGGLNDPAIDIIAYADAGGAGYEIRTLDATGVHRYQFGPQHNYATAAA